MHIFIKVLKAASFVWVMLLMAGIFSIGIYYWVTEGFLASMATFAPYNFFNMMLIALALAPGMGLFLLAEYLDKT